MKLTDITDTAQLLLFIPEAKAGFAVIEKLDYE